MVGILAASGAATAGPASLPTQGLPDAEYASSRRAELSGAIIAKWIDHVSETYRTSAEPWANALAPTLARAPVESLERALAARTFSDMNRALEGTASTGAPSPKALGDPAKDLVFVPITPCRIADTRVAGGAIPANGTRDFDITSISSYSVQGGDATNCSGAGAAGAFAAVALNFTVVSPAGAGYITAYPYLATRPLAATVNYGAGDVRGNFAIVQLDQGASAPEMTVYSFAQTHLVVDMVGYFQAPAPVLDCVQTTVTSFPLAANSVNFFNNPSCPAGYMATTPYCWTASSGVYSQGSGFNANAPSNQTFCSWQNTTAASQTVFGGNVCCRPR